jgi:hypothetical protein
MVLEQIVVLMVHPSLGFVSTPLLVIELEILALAWAIFGALAHLISGPT